jgi:spore coat polysaccharide biosynthesis protein SpsF
MKRRLVAALACRNTGSRLYGKPLQRINALDTILDQIVHALKKMPMIDEIVLGVSEGNANLTYIDVARAHGISYVIGDPEDVLLRLIQCGRAGRASDVFRVTTECPWFAYGMLPKVWQHHVAEGNDITVCDRLPEGLTFEIYAQQALERAHERGSARDRSEFCSNYPRTHPEEFKATVFLPRPEDRRMDLRVTVDYPEDLIIAREIARVCAGSMPLVPIRDIIRVLDERKDLQAMVRPYVSPEPLWTVFGDQRELDSDA